MGMMSYLQKLSLKLPNSTIKHFANMFDQARYKNGISMVYE